MRPTNVSLARACTSASIAQPKIDWEALVGTPGTEDTQAEGKR
jgi:hypothetical protein